MGWGNRGRDRVNRNDRVRERRDGYRDRNRDNGYGDGGGTVGMGMRNNG